MASGQSTPCAARDAIERDSNNNAELPQACYPEFQALLAPEDFTTVADVTAVWQKQPAA